MPRRKFEFDPEVVYQIVAGGGTAEDVAKHFGCKAPTVHARRYRDSVLDGAFRRGLADRKAGKARKATSPSAARLRDESDEPPDDGLSWVERAYFRSEQEAAYMARCSADRRLVSDVLDAAGRPLCRKELNELTLLGYDRINDALDWLKLHWMVREVPGGHWLIERYEPAEKEKEHAPAPFQMRVHNNDLFAP